jgi:hypothetical protein
MTRSFAGYGISTWQPKVSRCVQVWDSLHLSPYRPRSGTVSLYQEKFVTLHDSERKLP